MVSFADKLRIYEEEFDEIEKQMEIEGATKQTSRRMLIFTEAFMFTIIQTKKEEVDDEARKILKRLREKAGRHRHIDIKRLLGE